MCFISSSTCKANVENIGLCDDGRIGLSDKDTSFLRLTYFSSKLYHAKLVIFTPALSVKTIFYYSD